jgi:hypothetical protein
MEATKMFNSAYPGKVAGYASSHFRRLIAWKEAFL